MVIAPDKMRGTVTAQAVAAAAGRAAAAAGWKAVEVPVADGGEGTLDVLGGPNRTTTVTGPLGEELGKIAADPKLLKDPSKAGVVLKENLGKVLLA